MAAYRIEVENLPDGVLLKVGFGDAATGETVMADAHTKPCRHSILRVESWLVSTVRRHWLSLLLSAMFSRTDLEPSRFSIPSAVGTS